MLENRVLIAKRVAKELNDGDVVNLGISIPTLVANYIPNDKKVILSLQTIREATEAEYSISADLKEMVV